MHAPEQLLRNTCDTLMREIEVPEPFDLDTFARSVGRHRGRRLHLHDMPCTDASEQSYGAWIATESADHIFCVTATSPAHRTHIVLHEIAHMVCNHPADHVIDPALAEAVFPDLSPHVLTGMLRHSYASEAEREAEILAYLMLDHIEQRSRRKAGSRAWRRLQDVLGHPIRSHADA